jgi:hypothetical protein
MSKFIQVNKMWFDGKKYQLCEVDSLVNADHIIEVSPRGLEDPNDVFQGKNACHILMDGGHTFYVRGSFSDIKSKLGCL